MLGMRYRISSKAGNRRRGQQVERLPTGPRTLSASLKARAAKQKSERTALLFVAQVRDHVPHILREHRFNPDRQWRFDFALPDHRLAIEIEGGVWSEGRHTRASGFVDDCDKYASALLHGWRVLRVPLDWVTNGRALALTLALIDPTRPHPPTLPPRKRRRTGATNAARATPV